MDNLVLDIQFSNEGPEPVTLTDAKNWLKIDVSDDDVLLSKLISAARQKCETYTNISMIPRTVTAWLQIGLDEIRLPYGPVNTLTGVTNNKGEAIEPSGYVLKYEKFKALDPATEVKAVYTAGDTAEDLQSDFYIAILNQVAWMYEHRGDEAGQDGLAPNVINILKPYRRVT
jgi:uncharacterized phiE125 gp8 family phage protein